MGSLAYSPDGVQNAVKVEKDGSHVEEADTQTTKAPGPTDVDDNFINYSWRSWVVVLTAMLCQASFAIVVLSSGFWLSAVVASVGGAAISFWVSAIWNVISGLLAPPLSWLGDRNGRRWIWLITVAIGIVGIIIFATAQSIAQAIVGCGVWSIAFGNSGNLYAIPAEVLPRRHRASAALALQGGGYIGFIVALFGGAGFVVTRPGGYDGWRSLLWLAAGIHVVVLVLIFVFYRPVPTVAQREHSLLKAVSMLDYIGTALLACSFVPLIMALVWAGSIYPWKSAYVIAPLVVGIVFAGLLVVHQVFWAKHGIFHRELFKNRNVAICLFANSVEGFVFNSFNNFVGAEFGTLFPSSTYGLVAKFSSFILSAMLGAVVYAFVCYRYRALKEVLLVGFGIFLVSIILLATVKAGDMSKMIGYCVLAGLGFAGPISCLFSVVQLSVEPQYVGIASGLMITVRAVGGSLGPAISHSVSSSKVASLVPRYIAERAAAAGLAESSVSALVEALVSGNAKAAAAVPGVTPAILTAAAAGATDAYAKAYSYVWIVLAPFVFVVLVACIFVTGIRPLMTQAVDRPVLKQRTKTFDV